MIASKQEPLYVQWSCCWNQLCAQELFAAFEMVDILCVNVLCSQTKFTMRSGQTSVFAERYGKDRICVLLRGDSTLLPDSGMGGDTQNTRFFSWYRSGFHHLWVGKHMYPIPPAPYGIPCSSTSWLHAGRSVKISCACPYPRCMVSWVTCGITGECSVFHKDKPSNSQTRWYFFTKSYWITL